jgi:hypothetical protein
MNKLVLTGLAVACLSAFATSAIAGDEDDARVAIATAQGKLDSAEKAGVGGNAGDMLSQSRTVLEKATARFRKDEDRHALVLARQADALADLAIATSEMRALESERSKIAVN